MHYVIYQTPERLVRALSSFHYPSYFYCTPYFCFSQVREMQERLRLMKEEEERFRREEEEKIRVAEEAEKRREEKVRI